MLDDTSGSALATRVREGITTDDDVRLTAAVLSYLAVANANHDLSPWFVRSHAFDALVSSMSVAHPSTWTACSTPSVLTTLSLRPASCGGDSSCAPPLAALSDCLDGALELTFSAMFKAIPLEKFKAWTGLMDDAASKAHAVGADVLTGMKSAFPPLVDSRDIVSRFGQLIADAQVIAGAAAIVGVPDEPVLLVLGALGTAVNAYKCALNVHAVSRFVDACLDANRSCASGNGGSSSTGGSRCETIGGGGGAVSQCAAGKVGVTCFDGSTPTGCERSAGFGANGGILCCANAP